jgi:hypothetical protein
MHMAIGNNQQQVQGVPFASGSMLSSTEASGLLGKSALLPAFRPSDSITTERQAIAASNFDVYSQLPSSATSMSSAINRPLPYKHADKSAAAAGTHLKKVWACGTGTNEAESSEHEVEAATYAPLPCQTLIHTHTRMRREGTQCWL